MHLFRVTAWTNGPCDEEGNRSAGTVLINNQCFWAKSNDGCYRKVLTDPALGDVDIETVRFSIEAVRSTN